MQGKHDMATYAQAASMCRAHIKDIATLLEVCCIAAEPAHGKAQS